MIRIVNGTIPVAGHPGRNLTGTTGIVTQADLADQKRRMSVLGQLIEGGYTTGSLTFTIGGVSPFTSCDTSHLIVMITLLDSWG